MQHSLLKPIQISNTKIDLYSLCSAKYKYRYVDRLVPDKTYSSLLFGVSIDKALNYILTCFKKKRQFKSGVAEWLFLREMNTWKGQNEFVFFKSEIAEHDFDEFDPIGNQDRSFKYLCELGPVVIKTYIDKILPEIKEVIDVQVRLEPKNEEGDYLIIILDFIAITNDDRKVIFDNKTASKKYPKNKVTKSQQLALYAEFFPEIEYAGYITLGKKVNEDGYVTTQMLIDKVPETMKQEAFDLAVNVTNGIKEEKYEMNRKSCYSFGRPCEYFLYCQRGDDTGLIQKENRK